VGSIHALLNKFRDQVNSLTVYIKEAHAIDQWPLGNEVVISQHKNVEERINAAKLFQQNTNYLGPLVIDTMENTVNDTYAMWPEKAFIILDGKISYLSPPTIDKEMEWAADLEEWLNYYYDEIDNNDDDDY